MAKAKTSRIKRAEERIEAIVIELQKMGHLLNLTMNTLNEYISYNKDLKPFEKFIKDSQKKLEKEQKELEKIDK